MGEIVVKDQLTEATESVRDVSRDVSGQMIQDSRDAMTKAFEVWAETTRKFTPTLDFGGSNEMPSPGLGWIDAYLDLTESMLAQQRDWVHSLFAMGQSVAPADGDVDAKNRSRRTPPARR